MAFSIEEIGEIDHLVGDWCVQRVPAELKSKIDHDYEIDGQAVTILEVRPLWRGKPGEVTRRPFAKFRYIKTGSFWQIYWMRASGKWQPYEPEPIARDLESVLKIIEVDRYGCFFG